MPHPRDRPIRSPAYDSTADGLREAGNLPWSDADRHATRRPRTPPMPQIQSTSIKTSTVICTNTRV
ncbi:hypothetical protein [Azospirillum brasilense]|uniref:hypothetical protein n=1 Tax=Azospirillum brasilense TaxID=192 RepID=UPI0013B43FCC|nr:hypothetical protein [Azospirillum brasilense]